MFDIVKYIKDKTEDSKDMKYRTITVLDCSVKIVYNETLVDSDTVSDFVIRSIKKVIKEYKNKDSVLKKDNTVELVNKLNDELSAVNVKEISLEEDDIFYYIFCGFTLLIVEDKILAVETRAKLDRSISEAQVETSIKGPKDSFVENYVQNIGLIRKRLRTEKLILKENLIGRRSKTKVGILYFSDLADKKSVEKLEKSIKNIDIDGILDSNYIREIILSKGDSTFFPTVISTERPDMVAYNLLEGRIAVVVENSPFVLIFPAFLSDFFKNMDDYYQLDKSVLFTRVIRYLAFFITIITPAVYISLITFNHEAIPNELLISFAVQRDGVPAPAFLEAFIMIIAFELLREGDYRVPNVAGSTLSIVGALILRRSGSKCGNCISYYDYSNCYYYNISTYVFRH